jgi:hypothetical protein
LAALNAADILIGSIRKMNDMEPLSEENKLVRDAICKSLVTSISHADDFQSAAIATSVVGRRKAYVEKAGPIAGIPQAAKDWIVCQPLLPERGEDSSLFGLILPALNKFVAEYKKDHGQLPFQPNRGGARSKRGKKAAFSNPESNSHNFTPRGGNACGHGSNVNFGHRGRGNSGQFRGRG